MFTKTFALLLLFLPVTLHASTGPDGSISILSQFSVEKTADRFEGLLKAKGLTLFARVNHSANASAVNMELRPTELIIFGNPKLGTPLMQCQQTVGLDLPQKLLVWENNKGEVWLTYNAPTYVQKRHNIKACGEVLTKITKALAGLTLAAAQDK
jgi:uncharacterized protein (DUF302 family)